MKPCVLIPTYENPRTLADVVHAALGECADVIVVDDGSGPETRDILAAIDGIVVLRHERNSGKGAALRTGLAEAHARGFTHAISMDSDGQHLASEIPAFLRAIERDPQALILGNRDLASAGAGPGSRIGRTNSNFWTWVITGQRLPDTQTGFRVYPLASISQLHFTCTQFDFEIEVLVKASWSGVPLRSIPIAVRYFGKEERVSHMSGRDFLRIGHLNTRYVTMRICLPEPYLRVRSSKRFHAHPFGRRWKETLLEFFVREPGSAGRVAGSVGLGLFWGVAPVWGFQIALTLVCAHLLRLSKPISVVASHISFPLMIPPILYTSLVVGRLALGLPEGIPAYTALEIVPRADLPAYVVGSLLLGVGLAIVGGVLTFLLLEGVRSSNTTDPGAGVS